MLLGSKSAVPQPAKKGNVAHQHEITSYAIYEAISQSAIREILFKNDSATNIQKGGVAHDARKKSPLRTAATVEKLPSGCRRNKSVRKACYFSSGTFIFYNVCASFFSVTLFLIIE